MIQDIEVECTDYKFIIKNNRVMLEKKGNLNDRDRWLIDNKVQITVDELVLMFKERVGYDG